MPNNDLRIPRCKRGGTSCPRPLIPCAPNTNLTNTHAVKVCSQRRGGRAPLGSTPILFYRPKRSALNLVPAVKGQSPTSEIHSALYSTKRCSIAISEPIEQSALRKNKVSTSAEKSPWWEFEVLHKGCGGQAVTPFLRPSTHAQHQLQREGRFKSN